MSEIGTVFIVILQPPNRPQVDSGVIGSFETQQAAIKYVNAHNLSHDHLMDVRIVSIPYYKQGDV